LYLIQLLLPIAPAAPDAPDGTDAAVARTRRELVERFGGLTAYLRTPAHGVWTSPDGSRAHDDVVMVEVVAETFDRAWWRDYSARLAARFEQEAIHVRALQIEVLDADAT
jgi:hypothetical protein